jgi:hypothetical protein
MKKSSLFFIALTIAIFIAYNKPYENPITLKKAEQWKTFEKKSANKIVTHLTTDKELEKGHIERSIASEPTEVNKQLSLRENRILTGEYVDKYRDSSITLPMINKINPEWKEILGTDLLHQQNEDTKVIVKDELHFIKIKDGQGQYLEQVIITYFMNNGDQNSFHALVDSETGAVLDTWDYSIHERLHRKPQKLTPTGVSNIIGR